MANHLLYGKFELEIRKIDRESKSILQLALQSWTEHLNTQEVSNGNENRNKKSATKVAGTLSNHYL
jgi:hypothetical protein